VLLADRIGAFHDGVQGHQASQQRFEQVKAKRILGVAPGA
jgi:hypothetical protein